MVFPGWTWEYIDDFMTLPRLTAMYKHWEGSPPVHWMIAGYLGVKKDKAAAAKPAEQDLSELFALFPMKG